MTGTPERKNDFQILPIASESGEIVLRILQNRRKNVAVLSGREEGADAGAFRQPGFFI